MEKFYDLIKGKKPVLVEFYASWCPHCQRMQPVLEQFSKEMGDRLIITNLDIDASENSSLVERYQVQIVPTILLFRDGEQMWRQSGEMRTDQLNRSVGKYLK